MVFDCFGPVPNLDLHIGNGAFAGHRCFVHVNVARSATAVCNGQSNSGFLLRLHVNTPVIAGCEVGQVIIFAAAFNPYADLPDRFPARVSDIHAASQVMAHGDSGEINREHCPAPRTTRPNVERSILIDLRARI